MTTMQFTISREALLKPLQLVAGIVERRSTLPILANTLLSVKAQQLSLLATDMEVELTGRVALEEPAVPGEITVPARKLMDICRMLPEKAVLNFSMKDTTLIVKSGRSRFTLTTLPAADFPNIEETAGLVEFSIQQSDLRTLIEKTHFAMAQQDVRYYLNGMLLEIQPNQIRSVATDGHRLAMHVFPLTIDTQMLQTIIPRKAILELLKLMENGDENATINVGSNHIRASTADYTFSSRLIDGRFPAYDKVLPKGGDKRILVDRQILKQALTRVAILANEKSRGVCLQLQPEKMLLSANNPEQEQAEEEISIDYKGSELSIGLNVSYLLDVLSATADEQIAFTFSDQNSSVLIEEISSDKSVYVVMPMRL
jgi:DNA polymerase III subunit beta